MRHRFVLTLWICRFRPWNRRLRNMNLHRYIACPLFYCSLLPQWSFLLFPFDKAWMGSRFSDHPTCAWRGVLRCSNTLPCIEGRASDLFAWASIRCCPINRNNKLAPIHFQCSLETWLHELLMPTQNRKTRSRQENWQRCLISWCRYRGLLAFR
jgi:hypothetical protein